jgi:Flp pilus assembly pilin Flp
LGVSVALRYALPRHTQTPKIVPLATWRFFMFYLINALWSDEGEDIAEYAVMLAVILVLVVGTIRLVGSNANNAFSSVASSLQ